MTLLLTGAGSNWCVAASSLLHPVGLFFLPAHAPKP